MEVRKILILTLICAGVAAAVLLGASPRSEKRSGKQSERQGVKLLVFAGAGIQPPLDELGAAFTEKTGIRVEYTYKGSGCLLPDIVIGKKGDVYIPGELFYMEQAVDRGMIRKYRPAAQMTTVIICQAGNPRAIRQVEDLGRPGLRVGLGDAKAIAIGRAAQTVLEKAKCRQAVERNTVMSCMNVVELANAVRLRQLDAAIVWDGTAALCKGGVATVRITASCRETSTIPVGVLKSSQHPREAEQFMDFLAGAEAASVFTKHGYAPLKQAADDAGVKRI